MGYLVTLRKLVFFLNLVAREGLELQRRTDIEIQMREVQIAGVFREKAEFTAGPDLAMAHRLVPGMESLPKRIG